MFVPRFQPAAGPAPNFNRQNNPGSHLYQNGSGSRPTSSSMASQQHHHSHHSGPPGQQSQISQQPNASSYEYEDQIEDYISLSYLKDFITIISDKPAILNMHGLNEITYLVNSYLEEDDCVLELVVNQLVDQSIIDGNFRSNGVKIMIHFMSNIHETRSGTFKDLLFKRFVFIFLPVYFSFPFVFLSLFMLEFNVNAPVKCRQTRRIVLHT